MLGQSLTLTFINHLTGNLLELDIDLKPLLVLVSQGDIAQLGERRVRIAEVGGSNPPISILTQFDSVNQTGRFSERGF